MDIGYPATKEGDGAGGQAVGGRERGEGMRSDQNQAQSRRMDSATAGKVLDDRSPRHHHQSRFIDNFFKDY